MNPQPQTTEPFRPSEHTVLVIDDEADILELLTFNLRAEGYRVLSAERGEQGLELAWREKPSLVVLDLMLPDLPGLEVCRALRGKPETASIPILLLTARGAEIDRVGGFESGADDYVTKPFSVRELLLRVRARLRSAREPATSHEGPIRIGLLQVIPEAHRVLVGGEEVALSLQEFKLLVFLIKRRGRVQSRETLLSEVWGYSTDVSSRTIDTHVKRLRDKLGEAGRYLDTIRGVGYMFSVED